MGWTSVVLIFLGAVLVMRSEGHRRRVADFVPGTVDPPQPEIEAARTRLVKSVTLAVAGIVCALLAAAFTAAYGRLICFFVGIVLVGGILTFIRAVRESVSWRWKN
ncbi:hypothetical protein [Rhodococcus qingshengii]|uniref:hypothetical protein n=1 Tax=Rhodococcus qingshengii TaxID=334542 RepID=UPI001BE696D1|nr:hypothetical protein [Rhodococcus qingshengii]MBT2273807.1 hypothetical protein [Rhodococcus qingshengii]